jgi:DNA repair protein RecO (recombination protein O)
VPLEKATGVVIRLQDYSESSQIATFLTDRFGNVSVIAKGAKRAKSATGGALDMLTANEIVFMPSASGGLGTLREAHAVEQFQGLRASTDRYYAALYFAELSGIFGEGAEGTSALYELLVSCLSALSAPSVSVENVVAYFESRVLEASGFAPNLKSCARCGSPVAPRGEARISLEDGGILCPNCPGGVGVGRGGLAALRRVFESTVQSVQRLKLPREIRADVGTILAAFIVHNARRKPRLLKHVRPDFDEVLPKWMPQSVRPKR